LGSSLELLVMNFALSDLVVWGVNIDTYWCIPSSANISEKITYLLISWTYKSVFVRSGGRTFVWTDKFQTQSLYHICMLHFVCHLTGLAVTVHIINVHSVVRCFSVNYLHLKENLWCSKLGWQLICGNWCCTTTPST
jgi:hypothetical protein